MNDKIKTSLEESETEFLVKVVCTPAYVKEVEEHVMPQFRAANINGFRPGHTPDNVIKSKFNSEIKTDISTILISEATHLALSSLKIEAGARPRVTQESKPTASKSWIGSFPLDGTFKFSIIFEKPPKIDSVDFSNLVVVSNDDTDSVVSEQLTIAANEFRPLTDSEDVFQENSLALVKLEAFEGGKLIKELSAPQMYYSDAHLLLDSLNPEIGQKIRTSKKGDEFTVTQGEFELKITVLSMKNLGDAPNIDDELAKKYGFDTLDAFKQEIKNEYKRKNFSFLRAALHSQIREQLVAKNPFTMPESWFKEYEEKFKGTIDSSDMEDVDVSNNILIMAASDYLLELILDQKPDLRLTEEDLIAYAEISVLETKHTAKEFLQLLSLSRKLTSWKRDTQMIKVLDFLVTQATKVTQQETVTVNVGE